MNVSEIQKLIDMPDAAGAVKLPPGEFEGPFTVSRPCVVTGNGTTLWRRKGTVLEIRSKGVVLRNIGIESTGAEGGAALVSRSDDTAFRNVHVFGSVNGVPGEEGRWDLPRVMSVGNIPPDREFTAFAEVYVPVSAEVKVNISGVRAEPTVLSAGRNTVRFIMDPMSEGTVIYGEIEFRSKLIRKAYMTLSASSSGKPSPDGQYLFRAADVTDASENSGNNNTPPPAPAAVSRTAAPSEKKPLPSASSDIISLIRGQRIDISALGDSEITVCLEYDSADRQLDIDGYAFLLNSAGRAENDQSLVFFGNPTGAGGAVSYTDSGGKRSFRLELDRIPRDVNKISLAFSIYGDDPAENFSRVHGARLKLRSAGKTAEFRMTGLFLEKTIVAAEVYRRNDSWKISAVGQGYSNGLRRLCESFGFNIL